ncbi:MAG: hypothetical protein HPY66_1744 [Firmicutes bacterium]|nr:hypothetical protein [Bacillota bacterium]
MYYPYNYNLYTQSYPPSHAPCSGIRYFHPGDKAPDFTLEGVENLQLKSYRLRDYLGRWVLLFFYGSNFTFV